MAYQVENQRKKAKLDKTLKGLCVTGRLKEAVGLLWRSGLQVEPETYAVLLQECKQRKEYTKGKRIHAQMAVLGFAPNEYLKVKLLILYALSLALQTAGIIFRSLQFRDLIPWNAMIAGYVQKGLEQEGLYIYYEMRENRVLPDQYTFSKSYQNKRGGRFKLQPMVLPQSEFDHPDKGDALYDQSLTKDLENIGEDLQLLREAMAVELFVANGGIIRCRLHRCWNDLSWWQDGREAPSFLLESVESGSQMSSVGRYSVGGAQPAMEIVAKDNKVIVMDHKNESITEKCNIYAGFERYYCIFKKTQLRSP